MLLFPHLRFFCLDHRTERNSLCLYNCSDRPSSGLATKPGQMPNPQAARPFNRSSGLRLRLQPVPLSMRHYVPAGADWAPNGTGTKASEQPIVDTVQSERSRPCENEDRSSSTDAPRSVITQSAIDRLLQRLERQVERRNDDRRDAAKKLVGGCGGQTKCTGSGIGGGGGVGAAVRDHQREGECGQQSARVDKTATAEDDRTSNGRRPRSRTPSQQTVAQDGGKVLHPAAVGQVISSRGGSLTDERRERRRGDETSRCAAAAAATSSSQADWSAAKSQQQVASKKTCGEVSNSAQISVANSWGLEAQCFHGDDVFTHNSQQRRQDQSCLRN